MSTVDEWARRRAAEKFKTSATRLTGMDVAQWGYFEGVNDLAALLLSDEPVEAASAVLADSHDVGTTDCTRRALLAALTKITTNETEEKE